MTTLSRMASCCWLAALASSPLLAQGADANDSGLNRLDLHNGGDTLWFIHTTYIGSDPGNGNFNGDLYWKVYPRQAIQSCSGAGTLWGTEQTLYDLDWSDSPPLWAYLITPAYEGTDLVLYPNLDSTTLDGPGVFVPEVPDSGLVSLTGDLCPRPGYVGGWVFSDLFADTATGSLIPLMQASDPDAQDYFRADGTVDWSFVHFYSGHNQGLQGQQVFAPSPNGCGSGFSGSASFQWLGSTDGAPPFGTGGEHQAVAVSLPDPCSTGECTTTGSRSRYGGFQIGGKGMPKTPNIPEVQSGGADLAFLFEDATLSVAAFTGYELADLSFAPELGLAGLEFPIGWDTSAGLPANKDVDDGVPGSVPVSLGVHLYDQTAKTDGTSFGAFAVNLDLEGGASDLLIDLGLCVPALGGEFALHPSNPLFAPSLKASISAAIPFVAHPERPEETYYVSPQFTLNPDPSLLGVTLAFQGWTIDLTGVAPISASSQVVRTNLRDNTNVK